MSSQAEEQVVDQNATTKMQEAPDMPQKGNGLEVMEAAALLTVWSLLVINEGAIRFNDVVNVGPEDPGLEFGEGRPRLGLRFFASLFEVIFGFIGLFVGVSAFIYRAYSTPITKAAMVCQSLMGWFVFAIYVFAIPAYQAADTEVAPPPFAANDISLGLYRFLITLGIFTSFHWCLALQGGQFIFFARLVCAATGQDFLKQSSGLKMRAMFWSGNLALSGLWITITGGILINKVTGGTTPFVFEFPPNVGRLPTMLLIAGLVQLLTGFALMGMAAIDKKPPTAFYAIVAVSFLFSWLNFTIVQFGRLPKPVGGGVAMHAGLVFMLYFLGPYFLYKQTRSKGTVPEPEYAV